MSEHLSSLLDLRTAWRRVRADNTRYRVFIRHPHEIRLIEHDLDDWLADLDQAISSGTYSPGSLYLCDAPKGNGAVRPGGHLGIRDQVVYSALVATFSDQIREATSWPDRPIDFSYRLRSDANRVEWFTNPFEGWREFADKSIQKIDTGTAYVLTSDIAGYYETIDIATLISDVRDIDADEEAIGLLAICLNRWSQSQIAGRGVPQGFSPSDILAKLYLSAVDRALWDQGSFHYRYVDDFRVFCDSRAEAKKSLIDLTRALRRRGLIVQTAKSEIQRADEARERIEAVQAVIRSVVGQYLSEAAEALGVDSPYFNIHRADELLATRADNAPIALIRRAYQTYFIDDGGASFNKTLFRFLLRRLGNQGDTFALAHATNVLGSQPQETQTILRYIEAVRGIAEIESSILDYLESDEAVYLYQVYEVIEWYNGLGMAPSERMGRFVREVTFDRAVPEYVRSVGREFLGRFGSPADLDRLEESYAELRDDLERAEVICALRRREAGRRNAFLGRVREDGVLAGRAVALVRSGALT